MVNLGESIMDRGHLLNANQTAAFLGISRHSLRLWILLDRAPPRIRVGKRYYWTEEMLMQWARTLSLAD
jgi:predicted DNA-binding transcriptional regulator AlpA